jgi:hypothetical protein
MKKMRPLGLAAFMAPVVWLNFACTMSCFAQGGQPADKAGQKGGQGDPQGQQGQPSQPGGPIVAGPGSTVVVPAQPNASANNSGLIVAAPGSTVVVQQAQSASPSTKAPTTNKPNTFLLKTDSSTVSTLVKYATNKDSDVRVRAGAINALGTIGGGDQDTIDQIVKGLTAVLDMEFITNGKYTDGKGAGSSEFLCFQAVSAIGNLGWGGRTAIPQIQLLRGQNVILDGAIDHAISAMQNGPPAPQAASNSTTKQANEPANQPAGQ